MIWAHTESIQALAIASQGPENLFREHVKQTCEDGKELTSAGLMRLANRIEGGSRPDRNGHSNGKHAHALNGRS